jgi:glycosyltransferase involved in cell wall biosynthesis
VARSQWSEGGGQWADIAVPEDAIVFGRYGGDDSFDIPWVKKTVVETAKKRPDICFLFLNTREFCRVADLPNIRFLPPTSDPVLKRKFLNSCDAMLHGRQRGETFGLSCLEFAMLGKPVLTYADSPERAHLEILGDSAVCYENPQQLKELLEDRGRWSEVGRQWSEGGGRKAEANAHRELTNDYRLPSKLVDNKFKEFQPQVVMQKFKEVFLR